MDVGTNPLILFPPFPLSPTSLSPSLPFSQSYCILTLLPSSQLKRGNE